MRTLITIKILAALLLLNGCSGGKLQVSDQSISTVIALGTNLAFKYALASDVTERKTIAKYVSGIAGAVRSLTGKESAADAARMLAANIPPDVLARFPEIGTIVIPQVVSYFESAKASFSANTQAFASRMNAIATGLEQGVSEYL